MPLPQREVAGNGENEELILDMLVVEGYIYRVPGLAQSCLAAKA